jgi:NTP pyrophosphatase (non-canonical NTP hydrolase)
MSDLRTLAEQVENFVAEREWGQFHTLKDLAISLNLEASEVLELMQWRDEASLASDPKLHERLSAELADVLYWVLIMARKTDIDLEEAFHLKMNENAQKYPIEQSRGKTTKYTDL